MPAVLTTLWVGAWLFLGTGGCGPTPTARYSLRDGDRDGLPDWVQVADFDGDGLLEMDDIQDAMDALTDPGRKTILVQAGDYAGPTQPQLRPGRTHAILELRSYTTLICAGVGSTILHGAPLSTTYDYAIVANDDHVNGNVSVQIQQCEIDGDTPATYDGATFRGDIHRGVFFRRTTDGLVYGSYIHNTVHAGLYTSNSTRDRFIDNVVDSSGGWGDVRTTPHRQPCIYAFAYGGSETVDFVASGNFLSQCGFGLNTRAEHTDAPGDVIRNLLWEDNTIENMIVACIALRGVDGAVVRRNTCRAAGAFQLVRATYGTGYRWQGNDNANSNVLIEDVDVIDTQLGQAALDIGAFVDGLTIRRLSVLGTRDATGQPAPIDCVNIERPLRNAVLEDVELRDCGREGLVVRTVASPSGDPAESLVLRNLTLDQVETVAPTDTALGAGLRFVGPHAQLELENLELAGASGPELRFEGAVSNALLRNIGVESIDPAWLGAFSEAAAPACSSGLVGQWVTTTDGSGSLDCSFAPGTTGLVQVRCACGPGGWSPITWAASPGIEFASGVTHDSVTLDGVTVANARGVTGIRVGGTLTNFRASSITGIDDSLATDLPQRSAIDFEAASGWSVSGVTCIGTAPGVPCVE